MRALRMVTGLLLLPLVLQAQEDPRLAGRLDASTRAEVTRIVEAARAEGLPVEPLVDKALEGASRGAPGERITAAVDRLSTDMATARTALGGTPGAGELIAGAAALRAGATRNDLSALRHARADGALTVPLATLADLVARGVPVETAASVVQGLAERGIADAGFVSLRESVERDIGAGVPPAAAASVRGQSNPTDGVVPPGRGQDAPGRGKAKGRDKNSSG